MLLLELFCNRYRGLLSPSKPGCHWESAFAPLTPKAPPGIKLTMTNIKDLTTAQLQRILTIKSQIEELQEELESIGADGPAPRRGRPPGKLGRPPGRPKGRKMSAAGRRAIAAAAKKRWAAYRGEGVAKAGKPAGKKRRKMSAAGRAKIAAAARERWKKAKAAGKTRL